MLQTKAKKKSDNTFLFSKVRQKNNQLNFGESAVG
jgi:hypothetical protein